MAKNPSEISIDARNSISNALNIPEILENLKNFNINERNLNEGLNLCDEVDSLISIQKKEYGESFEISETFKKTFHSAYEEYSMALKIAKIVFRSNLDAEKALVLSGLRKQSFKGWLERAKPFYENLQRNEEYLKAMSTYGYTPDKMQRGIDLMNECVKSSQSQMIERHEAVTATKDRDAKVDQLENWLADYKAICKLALGKNSELYKTLGF